MQTIDHTVAEKSHDSFKSELSAEFKTPKFPELAKSFHDWNYWKRFGHGSYKADERTPQWAYQHWVSLGYSDPRTYWRIASFLRGIVWLYAIAVIVAVGYGMFSISGYLEGIGDEKRWSEWPVALAFILESVLIAQFVLVFPLRDAADAYAEDRTAPFCAAFGIVLSQGRLTDRTKTAPHAERVAADTDAELVQVAALWIVFLEFEKGGYHSRLSQFASTRFSRLFDTGKALKFVSQGATFGRFFDRAKALVPGLREQFNQTLAELPEGELPELFWSGYVKK